jgi:hypothetical protein
MVSDSEAASDWIAMAVVPASVSSVTRESTACWSEQKVMARE